MQILSSKQIVCMIMDMNEQPLTQAELRMWLAMLRGTSLVNRQLAYDMQNEHRLHISLYDVLVRLYHSPDYRQTMSELAGQVIMSGSGLTRLLDKMVEAGLVHRQLDPTDRRLIYAELSEAGREKAAALMVAHQQRIQNYVMQHLTAEEVETMTIAFERVLDAFHVSSQKSVV